MSPHDGQGGDFADVRRQGMDAVADAFARFADQIPGLGTPPGGVPPGGVPGTDPVGMLQIRAAVARAVDVFADLLQRTFELYADALEEAARAGGAAGSGADGSSLELAGAPGTRAQAPVWIHNSTDRPVSDVELRMTDLTAADGSTIEASTGTFSPSDLTVTAGASAVASLSVSIPPAAAPGTYYGHVLGTGLAGTSLYVRLVVRP
jgi:hypothetical protein